MSEGGNLRNGANAGFCYLNCWNRLDRANWNYLSANFWNEKHNITVCTHFVNNKLTLFIK
nr:MAG TPA: hypothetical protein [Caudoviricetes sp.]DAZ48662.1 MAG TPA: hypothetical protein [Caudoviricetes sp.]